MRLLLLLLCTLGLAAADAPTLYQRMFPQAGPAQAPYQPARYRIHLNATTMESLQKLADQEQALWEHLYREQGAAGPVDPLVAYAFGDGERADVIAAAPQWTQQRQYDLARLLVAEMYLDDAAPLVRSLCQADPREPIALRAAFLCGQVRQQHAAIASVAATVPLHPDWDLTWASLENDPHWTGALRAIAAVDSLPLESEEAAPELVERRVTIEREWAEGEVYRYEEGALEDEIQVLDAWVQLRRALATSCPGFGLNRRDDTWPRRKQVVIDLNTPFHGPVALRLYRFDDQANWDSSSPQDIRTLEPVRTWAHAGMPLAANNRYASVREYIPINKLEHGYYLLTAHARYAPVLACFRFSLGDTVLAATATESELIVDAVRRDGSDVGSIPITLDIDSVTHRLTLDAQGRGRMSIPSHTEPVTIDLRGPGLARTTLTTPSRWTPEPDHRVLAWNAQHLIKPGETAHFAAVIRDMDLQGTRDGAGNRAVPIEIKGSDHDMAFSTTVRAGDQGLLTWSWPIPDTQALGRYQVWVDGQYAHTANLTVAEFQPERITFNAGFRHFRQRHDKPIQVNAHARYLSGEGVAAPVQIRIWHPASNTVLFEKPCALTDGALELILPAHPELTGHLQIEAHCAAPGAPPRQVTGNMYLKAEPFLAYVRDAHSNPRIDESYTIGLDVEEWTGEDLPQAQVRVNDTTDWHPYEQVPLPCPALGAQIATLTVRCNDEEVTLSHRYTIRPKREQLLIGDKTPPPQVVTLEDTGSHVGVGTEQAHGTQNAIGFAPLAVTIPVRLVEYRPLPASITIGLPRWIIFSDPQAVDGTITITPHAESPAPAAGYAVLLTVSREEILYTKRLRLGPGQHAIALPAERHWAPGVIVDIVAIDGHDLVSDRSWVDLLPPGRDLDLSLSLNRTKYRPGETAQADITLVDGLKQPVPDAVLTLAVVDAGIDQLVRSVFDFNHNLHRHCCGTPFTHAFRHNHIGSSTIMAYDHDYPAMSSMRWWLGGRAAWVENNVAPGERPAGARYGGSSRSSLGVQNTRTDFRHLVHWQTDLRTDAEGRCSTTWAMGDALTKWRVSVVAVGHEGASASTRYATTSQQVRLRPEIPRLLRQGDKIRMPIALSCDGEAELKSLSATYSAVNRAVDGEAVRALNTQRHHGEAIPNLWLGDSLRVPSSTSLRLRCEARTTIGSDATEQDIPIIPAGEPRRWHDSGTLTRSKTLSLRSLVRVASGPSELSIRASFGLSDDLDDACADLRAYPYGCTEQTLSRFYPAVIAAAARGAQREADLLPNIDRGIQRLAALRLQDGSWPWFQGRASTFLTAYAVSALCHARQLDRLTFNLQPSIDWLVRHPPSETDSHRAIGAVGPQAWYAQALVAAHLAGFRVDELALREVITWCSTCAADRRAPLRERALAMRLCHQLDPTSIPQGDLMGLLRTCDPAKSRAEQLACADLLACASQMDLNSASDRRLAEHKIEELLALRTGRSWVDTFMTAHMVLGLAGWQDRDPASSSSLTAILNGKQLGRLSAGDKRRLLVRVDAKDLKKLQLKPSGGGTIRWFTSLRWHGERAPNPVDAPLRVELQRDAEPVGTRFELTRATASELELLIHAEQALPFALLEIPRPSGLRITKVSCKGLIVAEQQDRDELTALCFNTIPAGTWRIQLSVVPTLAGTLHMPAASLQSMYGDAVPCAVSWPETLVVTP
ncbi:MAG: MG2 domain-containing protein [Planctomycetota bacterium]|jgi:hypothetical protein|nr:MG2 domain-containing protein [Planctomycetota bacterium]